MLPLIKFQLMGKSDPLPLSILINMLDYLNDYNEALLVIFQYDELEMWSFLFHVEVSCG